MTGYQEILTDPSYRGQMVCMTYPLIGNYGINPEDVESRRPWLAGFIVKEACPFPSSWRARVSLDTYLREHRIVGIQGIDTRALTRHLRDHGAQEGIISTEEPDAARLAERARALPGLLGRDLVTEVSVDAAPRLGRGRRGTWRAATPRRRAPRFKVIAFDSGIKQNILRCLSRARLPGRGGAREHERGRGARAEAGRRSSSPTAPAIPRRCRTSSRPCAGSSGRCRSSASASATRSSGSRSAAAPTSSSSAITAATTR